MNIFQLLFRPSFWLMNSPFCQSHEEMMTELLHQKCDPIVNDGSFIYRIVIGESVVWVANYPYAVYIDKEGFKNCRPSRLTILKLKKKILNETGYDISKGRHVNHNHS